MLSINVSFETVEEAIAFLSGASPRAQATIAASESVDKAKAAIKAGKPKADTPAPAPVAAASAPAPAASAPSTASATPATVGEAGVPYPVLQKAVFALAAMGDAGKKACGELVTAFKVNTFKDLDASKYAEALEAVQAKTVELQAAKALA